MRLAPLGEDREFPSVCMRSHASVLNMKDADCLGLRSSLSTDLKQICQALNQPLCHFNWFRQRKQKTKDGCESKLQRLSPNLRHVLPPGGLKWNNATTNPLSACYITCTHSANTLLQGKIRLSSLLTGTMAMPLKRESNLQPPVLKSSSLNFTLSPPLLRVTQKAFL